MANSDDVRKVLDLIRSLSDDSPHPPAVAIQPQTSAFLDLVEDKFETAQGLNGIIAAIRDVSENLLAAHRREQSRLAQNGPTRRRVTNR